MKKILAVLGLISTPTLAGVVHQTKIIESSSCIANIDCKEFLELPNVTATACRKVASGSKCVVRFGTCLEITDHVGTYNKTTKICDYKAVMPELGITCYSDSDCVQDAGIANINDTFVTFSTQCMMLGGKNFGVCTDQVAYAICCAWGTDETGMCLPQSKYCFSNSDCYTDNQVCHNNQCQTPSFSQEVGDGNTCNTNNDCDGDMISWGKLCVEAVQSPTGNLCQECAPNTKKTGLYDIGCTEERPYCSWGLSWKDPVTAEMRSYYGCSTQ